MNKFRIYFFISFLTGVHHLSFANVSIPGLRRDSMVLQRDSPIKLWGWAGPGEKIAIDLNKKKYITQASAAGDWSIILPAISYSPLIITFPLHPSERTIKK